MQTATTLAHAVTHMLSNRRYLSLAKPRYNAEAVLKSHELFIYGDMTLLFHFVTREAMYV
jgi:hypothetical protein